MSETALELAIIGAYLVAALAIGIAAFRASRYTAEDYYLASRTLGTLVLLFTMFATLLSAFTFFGGPNIAYRAGPEWILVMGLMDGVLFALLWYFVGYRQWLIGRRSGHVTLGALLGDRFSSPTLRVAVAALSLFWLFPYVMLQQMGAGTALEVLTEGAVPYWAGAGLITAFMIAYVVLAGLRGIAWTDTLQGAFMLLAVWAAFAWVLVELGGPVDATALLAEAEPGFLALGGGLYTPEWMISTAVSIAFGVIMFPQINQRFFVARSVEVLKRSLVLWPLLVVLLFVPAFMLGAWARGAGLEMGETDNILPVLLDRFTPVWFGALVIAGAMAAMMSSSDSMLLSGASYVTHDLYRPLFHRALSEEREQLVARIVVVAFALLAYAASLTRPGTLIGVGKTAFGGFAQLAPPVILALYARRVSAAGLLAGIVCAQAFYMASVLSPLLPETWLGWDAAIWGMGLGLAVTLIVSRLAPASR